MDECELRRVLELFGYWNRGAEQAPELTDGQIMEMAAFVGQPAPMSEEMRKSIAWAEEMKSRMTH